MKKVFSWITLAVLLGTSMVAVLSPKASAQTYQPWSVYSYSDGAVAVWNGICGGSGLDDHSYPCGTREVRNPGQTFTRTVDWDVIHWNADLYCLRYSLNGGARQTDCGYYRDSRNRANGIKKVVTDQKIEFGIVRR